MSHYCYINFQRVLTVLLYFILLSVQLGKHEVQAKLAVFFTNNTIVTPTFDYVNTRVPYYEQNGVLFLYPLVTEGTRCEYHTISPRQLQLLNDTFHKNPEHKDFAMIIFWDSFLSAECWTLHEAGLAVEKLSRETFVPMGLPPVSLIIMSTVGRTVAPRWGPRAEGYRSHTFSIPDGPVETKMMFVDDKNAALQMASINEVSQLRNYIVTYQAVQERGIWNDYYLSTGFNVYLWFLRVLLGAASLYAIIRVVRLAQLKKLHWDIRLVVLAIAVITNIATIIFLDYLAISLLGYSILFTIQFLSAVALDILLLYWSIRGASAFSRVLVLGFRIFIVIHIMLEVARLVFNYYNLSIPSYIDKTKAHYDFTEYVVPVIFGFSAIAFLGFSAWFMHAVYRLRSHSKARWRFLQLVIFSFVAALTFTIEFSRIMRLNMEGQTSSNFAVNELLFFETANFTSTAIRSFICLAVLGIAWPTDSTNTGASSTNDGTKSGWYTRMWRRLVCTSRSSAPPSDKTTYISENGKMVAAHPGMGLRHNLLGEETTINMNVLDATVLEQTIVADDQTATLQVTKSVLAE